MTAGIEITWNVKQQHIVQWTEFLYMIYRHDLLASELNYCVK